MKTLKSNRLYTSFYKDKKEDLLEIEDFKKEITLLSLEGSMLVEEQFFLLKQSTEIANTLVRFFKTNKTNLPFLTELVSGIDDNKFITKEIQNKLSEFAKAFNEQKGTLYISVIDRGRFRCNWDNIDKALSDKMIEHVSKYYVPGSY